LTKLVDAVASGWGPRRDITIRPRYHLASRSRFQSKAGIVQRPSVLNERGRMPPPTKVELLPHDPDWSHLANAEARLLTGALGPNLRIVHHVGSTAIPSIRAKPILDLMPVVSNLAELDKCQAKIKALGYEWWGELGLPGRRYCTKSDPKTGHRTAQLHCYEDGSTDITRHLAFRDYLRAHPELAAEYDRVKAECQRRHPGDSHAYGDCKEAWIRNAEADALEWYQA